MSSCSGLEDSHRSASPPASESEDPTLVACKGLVHQVRPSNHAAGRLHSASSEFRKVNFVQSAYSRPADSVQRVPSVIIQIEHMQVDLSLMPAWFDDLRCPKSTLKERAHSSARPTRATVLAHWPGISPSRL